jgi:toxin ParE1/3/4
MKQLHWSSRAFQDLEHEREYLGSRNPRAADEFLERVLAVVEILRENPELGRTTTHQNVRELIVSDTQYIIPYRVDGDVIVLLSVFHTKRDPRAKR